MGGSGLLEPRGVGDAAAVCSRLRWLEGVEAHWSLNEIELKKQLKGVLALIAAGGLGDSIVRDG